MVSLRHLGRVLPELQTWSGRTIDVPSAFISGKQDWGTYQRPGVFEAMQTKACTNMIGCHLVDGAGHWVQQEQPAEVSRLLVQFLQEAKQQGAKQQERRQQPRRANELTAGTPFSISI